MTHPDSAAGSRPAGLLPLGLLALAGLLASSAALAAQHLGAIELPGCGAESACARAAASVWGRVPGIGWPTSHVGVAYAVAWLAAWLVSSARPGTGLRWILRAGVAASLILAGAMFAGGYLCRYCVLFHVAHVVLWLLVEWRGATGATTARTWGAALGGFALASLMLAVVEGRTRAEAERRGEEELAQSTERILQAPAEDRPFTGRFVQGPDTAPIRVVVFSDYQCPACRQIEGQLRGILASRDDVSFSPKHFPFCVDCNDRAQRLNRNRHPNACWAARAAEAAGMLGGREVFFRMHRWLFDRKGQFDDATLRSFAQTLGLDPDEFSRTMHAPETLERVRADVGEALELGLHFTPMIFVNGVELKGWSAPEALVRTVERVAAQAPPALGAEVDRPPSALEKGLADWREQPLRRPASEERHRWFGPPDGTVEVIVWGDYQEPTMAELEAHLRAVMEENPRLRYSFRHFPFDLDCNSTVPRSAHPTACRAHRAAEAVGRFGPAEDHLALHRWLLDHPGELDSGALRSGLIELGIDPDAVEAWMQLPEVERAIADDIAAGKALGLHNIPHVVVNGRYVPRWRFDGRVVLDPILEQASTQH